MAKKDTDEIQDLSNQPIAATSTDALSHMPDGTYAIPVGEAHIGAGLLDIVSSAMYGNALDILREYLQNSVDAGADHVDIEVTGNDLVISDNGGGMDVSGLDNARRLGVSDKTGTEAVGFRGIGLYSSYNVCQRLVITSRPRSNPTRAYQLTLSYADMHAARARAQPRMTGSAKNTKAVAPSLHPTGSLLAAIADFSSIRDAPNDTLILAEPGKGRTVVRLVDCEPAFLNRVRARDVGTYLASAVPLAYPSSWEHTATVSALLSQALGRPGFISVSRILDGANGVALEQPAPNVATLRPFARTLRDKENRIVAFAWGCIAKEREGLEPEAARGLQLRFKGFGIGNKDYAKALWPSTGGKLLYQWVAGEVHVLDRNVVPTADRQDFEDSAARDALRQSLTDFFKETNRAMELRRRVLRSIELRAKKGETAPINHRELKKVTRRIEDLGIAQELSEDEILDSSGLSLLHGSGQQTIGLPSAAEPENAGTRTGGLADSGHAPRFQGDENQEPSSTSSRTQRDVGVNGADTEMPSYDDGFQIPSPELIATSADLLDNEASYATFGQVSQAIAYRWPEASTLLQTIDDAVRTATTPEAYQACVQQFANYVRRRRDAVS